jgi:tetratricopeptide (TPR) repeat protein
MRTRLFLILIIAGLTFSSCEEWLSVGAVTEMTEDDMFSSDEGFHAALSGIYIGMGSQTLYAKHLTWHMLDFLAHYYAQISGMTDTYLHSHQYQHQNVKPYILLAWQDLYELIANCNNILEHLEINKDKLNLVNYQLVKGEALALRAFFHFDLMRLFGYGGLDKRDVSGKLAIPYVTTYSKAVTPQRSYAETLTLLKKDLYDACVLLWGENGENCYRYTYDDSFFDAGPNGKDYAFFTYFGYQNSPRVDYYVARAILARVLMWEGNPDNYGEIVEIADEWIATEDDSGQDNWDWVSRSRVTSSTLTSRDKVFTQEHIWHLHVRDFTNIIDIWLDASNPNSTYERVFLLEQMAFEIFEVDQGNNVGISDYRYSYLLQPQGSGMSNYATLKLSQNNGELNASYKDLIPLISTPELYYMKAEIYAEQGNLPLAIECLNTVRRARGIITDLVSTLNYVEVRSEILKEYRKEYVSLGQLFYFYKRWNVSTILGYAQSMTDAEYVLPYPDEEVIQGGRNQW